MTRSQRNALTTRPDLLAQEAAAVAERRITWTARLGELHEYGTRGGGAGDRRLIVEAMADLQTSALKGSHQPEDAGT